MNKSEEKSLQSSESKNEAIHRRNIKIAKGLFYSVLIAGAIYTPISALQSDKAIETLPKQPEITIKADKSITYITVAPGAELHHEPNDSLTDVDKIESIYAPVEITARNNDILTGLEEGSVSWRGIPVNEIKESYPDFDAQNDKDGYIWIHEKDAQVAQPTPNP